MNNPSLFSNEKIKHSSSEQRIPVLDAPEAVQHLGGSVLIQICVLALERVCMHVIGSSTLCLVRLTAQHGGREGAVCFENGTATFVCGDDWIRQGIL